MCLFYEEFNLCDSYKNTFHKVILQIKNKFLSITNKFSNIIKLSGIKKEVKLNFKSKFERNTLLLSTCCYFWVYRISRVIADVYRRTKWLSICYNKDIIVARSVIKPCNIDIVAYCCYLRKGRISSIVAQVYWCTKAYTVIVTKCKEEIKVASSSLIKQTKKEIVSS